MSEVTTFRRRSNARHWKAVVAFDWHRPCRDCKMTAGPPCGHLTGAFRCTKFKLVWGEASGRGKMISRTMWSSAKVPLSADKVFPPGAPPPPQRRSQLDKRGHVVLPDQAIPETISEGRAKFRKNNKTLLWDEFS